MRHGRDAFGRHHVPAACPLILAGQSVRQPVQRWVQGARHVGVSGLGAAQRGRGVRRQFTDERGEEVGVACLSGLDQAVHVNVEQLLFEGTGEDAVAQVLHPGEQGQVQVIAAVAAQHVHPQEDLALCDLLAGSFALSTRKPNAISFSYRLFSIYLCRVTEIQTWQNSTQHS